MFSNHHHTILISWSNCYQIIIKLFSYHCRIMIISLSNYHHISIILLYYYLYIIITSSPPPPSSSSSPRAIPAIPPIASWSIDRCPRRPSAEYHLWARSASYRPGRWRSDGSRWRTSPGRHRIVSPTWGVT